LNPARHGPSARYGREGELSPTCQGYEAPLAGHDHPFVAAIPAERAAWDTERTNAEIGAELDISPKDRRRARQQYRPQARRLRPGAGRCPGRTGRPAAPGSP